MKNLLKKINWYKVVKGIGYFDLAYGAGLAGGGIALQNDAYLIMGITNIIFGAFFVSSEEV